MDSDSHLDYALFQLTPTRTRCDLVVFCGKKKEKVASGLVEPFISHLRYAKEQIPKGGYSITLRPPSSDSPWFTKGTLERFVRFVSTPEVLERFVTIEREIEQIERSVQSNELSNNNAVEPTEDDFNGNTDKAVVPFKPKGEGKDIDGSVQEDSAKLHLQRVLETRKAVLRKEQAMAYFRAFVAGYEMDCLEDLIAFADAFGASRLRDACMNFKELCYKKHNDGLWMDELAAMEAYAQPELPYLGTSGVVLTTENSNMSHNIMQGIQNGPLPNGHDMSNGSGDAVVSESVASHTGTDVNPGQMPPTASQSQYPMSWQNQPPPFMYNFPNHQMSPYQGYPFPGMHPSHYQGNMQWPPNREMYNDGFRGSGHHRNRKSSSRKKDKSHEGNELQISEQEEHSEPSDSTSEGEGDAYSQNDHTNSSGEQPHKRRNGKKSSRMVVIRNINYITSKRKDEKNDESGESSVDGDEFIDSDALKQQLDDAVGSVEKHSLTPPHLKKKGDKKTWKAGNRSIVDAEQELENDSSGKGVQTNENWGAFQNLLLKVNDSGLDDVENQHTLDVRDEYFTIQRSESGPIFGTSHAAGPESEQGMKKRLVAPDSFDVTGRNNTNEAGTHSVNFEEGENFSVGVKKRDYADEELLFSQRNDDIGRNTEDRFLETATKSSLIKNQRGEDWFIVNQPDKSVVAGATKEVSIFDADKNSRPADDYSQIKDRNAFVDDSFMIQDRSSADYQADTQWKTDISMVSGLSGPQHENGFNDLAGDKAGTGLYEPDDLYMVLDRNSGVEPAATWAPEVDYAMEISFTESGKQQSSISVDGITDNKPTIDTTPETKSNGGSEKKQVGKDMRSKPVRGSLGKSKTEIISRTKKPSTPSRVTMQRTKFETEEETRKRMEELLIERQKRIAERTAAKGSVSPASKKAPAEIKKVKPSAKDNKRMSPLATKDTKKSSPQKSGITTSTVNHLTLSSMPSKSTQFKKTIPKVNGEMFATLSRKASMDENKKSKFNPAKSSTQIIEPTLSDVKDKNQTNDLESKLETQARVPLDVQPLNSTDIPQDKELCGPPSPVANIEPKHIAVNASIDKSCIQEPSLPNSNHSAILHSAQLENEKLHMASELLDGEEEGSHYQLQDNGTTGTEVLVAPSELETVQTSPVVLGMENGGLASTEILEEDNMTEEGIESTPPSTIQHNLDHQVHSRKKWTTDEGSFPTAKGFRKLLMFGRKKAQVAA